MKAITFVSDQRVTQGEFRVWAEKHAPQGAGRCELVDGHIVMEPPAGWGHGAIEAKIVSTLERFAKRSGTGIAFGSSTGFELPSGDTVEPDASFVSRERWSAVRGPSGHPPGFARVVPDLVVEILSPGSAARDRVQKKRIYETNGVREYWLVDPRTRSLTQLVSNGARFDTGAVHEEAARVSSHALPGLRIRVGDLFVDA